MTKKKKPEDIKRSAWRPFGSVKFTPEELKQKATEYFSLIDNINKKRETNWIKIKKPKTITWFCLFAWVDRDYVGDKLKDADYFRTIKEIRMEIENSIEEWILEEWLNTTAWIFNLKNNFGWKDKLDIDQNNHEIKDDDLTEEQRKAIASRFC